MNSTGVKGKATKNKSSQKNKTKQKLSVVINNTPPPVNNKEIEAHIEQAVHAMLEPDPSVGWCIPRQWPVDNCPINYRRDVNVSSPNGALITFTPDLDSCLEITTSLSAPVTSIIGAGRVFTAGFESVSAKWYTFEYEWRDATGSLVQALPFFLADEASSVAVLLDGSVHLDKSIRYVGNPTVWGNEQIAPTRVGGVTTNLTQRARTFNAGNVLVASDLFASPAAPSGTITNNAVAIAGSEYFTLDYYTANTVLFTSFSVGLDTSTIVSSSWSTKAYDPAPSVGESLYRTVVDSSSKYSFPFASILATYTGSELLNGGTVAVGVVPFGFPLARVPALAFEQIAALGSRSYVGPMKKGAHGFYIPDDITRIAFLEMNEKVKGRSIAMAFLPQTNGGIGADSIVQLRVEIRSHIEFINSSQTLFHMTCGKNCQEVIDNIIASIEANGSQVGENPSHIKRIFAAAKSVAKDPRVREEMMNVMKFVGKSALKAAPLLLTAV